MRIASSIGSSLLLQARNLIISVLVYRLIADPAEVWGTINNVLAVVTLAALPGKFGLEYTAVYFVSKYRDERPEVAVKALQASTILRLTLTTVVASVLVGLPGPVGMLTGLSDVPGLVQIGGLLLFSSSVYEFASFLLSSTDNFPAMLAVRLLYTILNISLVVYVAVDGAENPVDLVILSQVVAGVGAALLAWFFVRRDLRKMHDGASSPFSSLGSMIEERPAWNTLLTFSFPMTLSSAANQIFNYVDRVLIPVLASRTALAHYAVANSVVSASLFGTYAFRNVARAQLPAQLLKDPPAARARLMATYRASFAVAVLINAGILSMAPDLVVAIYGEEATEAAHLLVWFVPWVFLSAHGNLSATALVCANRPRTYAVLMGALSAVNVGLNVLLIPRYEGAGAIAASTFALAFLAVLAYREVARSYGEELWSLRVALNAATPIAHISAMGALAWLAGVAISSPDLAASLGAGVAVTAVFLGSMWMTGEVKTLRAAM